MNFRFSNIPPVRWLFLGAVVVAVLAVGWVLTEESRTGLRNHHVGRPSLVNWITGQSGEIKLERDNIYWDYNGPGQGILTFAVGRYGWEVAHSEKKVLEAVSAADVWNAVFQQESSIPSPSPDVTLPIKLVTYDDDILIVRLQKNRDSVYALQAVEQKDGRGHFRSRRILPAAGGSGAGSNAAPSPGVGR